MPVKSGDCGHLLCIFSPLSLNFVLSLRILLRHTCCLPQAALLFFYNLIFMKPTIAIIEPDTLAALGLAYLIQRMMPGAEISTFSRSAELMADDEADAFFHYFVSADELLHAASYFLSRQHKTIVLLRGEDMQHLPQGFHVLNVWQKEAQLVRSIIHLAHTSHNRGGAEPEVVRQARHCGEERCAPQLTPRERDVLTGIVAGLTNKEIAQRMGVSPATVITHRKNLTEKLGTRSVSALTIFAVAHGIVRSEQIG